MHYDTILFGDGRLVACLPGLQIQRLAPVDPLDELTASPRMPVKAPRTPAPGPEPTGAPDAA